MSDDTTVELTEREVQEMKRGAFMSGVIWRFHRLGGDLLPNGEMEAEARRRYPIRRKARRIWNGGSSTEVPWCVSRKGGHIVYRNGEKEVEPGVTLTEERVRAWVDLFDNPDKYVEE